MSHTEQSPGHKIFTPTDVDLCACVIWCIWKCMVCDKRHMQNITMIFLIKLFLIFMIYAFFLHIHFYLFIWLCHVLIVTLGISDLSYGTWDL